MKYHQTAERILSTSNFLELNGAIIKRRWPNIWKMIYESPGPREVLFTADTPQPTLVIDGIHLTSAYDQEREASIQASLIPVESRNAWVYGIGLGHLPRTLLKRPALDKLAVVTMNPAVSMQSFAHFDHSDWLSDPRVEIISGEDEKEVRFPLAALPSCLELAGDQAARLRDLVSLELATPFIRESFETRHSEIFQRLEDNLSFIHSDGDVSELFGSKKGRTFLVAAAGPTLSNHYEWIRNRKEKSPLIAVDAALKPLAEAEIFPDVVVTADPKDGVVSFFRGVELTPFKDSFLVYFPVVHGDVLRIWPGPRLTAYSNHARYRKLVSRIPKGELFLSGSVIHPAIDLAVKMGASRVILLGTDFSFPGGFSHVRGSVPFKAVGNAFQNHWVFNGFGEKISTLANLRGYLRDLERYIAARSGALFINGSKDGARIEGTVYLEDYSDE